MEVVNYDAASMVIGNWLERSIPAECANHVQELGATIATTIGGVRTRNEDLAVILRFSSRCGAAQSFILCVLCDGVSALPNGRKAAITASMSLLMHMISEEKRVPYENLGKGIEAANRAVRQQCQPAGGTTLVTLLLSPSGSLVAGVGDSRVYAYLDQKLLRQVTVDDTLEQALERFKDERGGALNLRRFSHRLTRFIGMEATVQCREYSLDTGSPRTVFILSSDGASEVLRLESVLRGAASAGVPVGLMQLSAWCSGGDNATLLSIRGDAIKSLYSSNSTKASRLEIWDSAGKLTLDFEHSLRRVG
jgi:serine/threonine protein phosphatase PrpC